uniref:Leucine-rich repeat-containing N-terminal plant-type domain-containing protein n=1 Tax=Triticum aestivum TaxID=4565 RepID=A0A077S6Y3_WHEAT|nr:unnamed protein product [Triticum aestivum]
MRATATSTRPAATKFLLTVVVVLSLALATYAVPLSRPTCVPEERDALLSFKEGVTSDPGGLLTSWRRGSDCCRWRHVRCSNQTGRVVALSLRNAPGGAELDDRGNDEGALVGRISPSLLSLSRLRHLDLSRNYLEGSPDAALPAFLGGLRSLRYLNLSGIYFSGEVPPQLGNLSRLRSLDLSSDFGTQLLRSSDLSWLARLPLLRHLSLSSIDMSRAPDWPRAVSMLPSLKTLYLSSCSLPSTNHWKLPAAGLRNLTNLEELDLSMNHLNHPAAYSWFWNVTSLTHINLMGTFLSGQLPNALDAMVSLEILDFSYNGNMATMPRSLRNLCNLRYLDLESSLVGGQDIVKLMESLPQGCPSNRLQQLYLANNGIGHFARLSTLDLRGNYLTGHVPPQLGMLSNLTYLDISLNDLHGVLTEEHFAKMASLETLDLSQNPLLKIHVDSEWKTPFKLRDANFSLCIMGPLFPAWLQWQVNLTYLDISSSGITDKLPDWFTIAFSTMDFLDMSNNSIYGELPENMEDMSLTQFFLDSNRLTGPIPSLPRNIIYLDISMNSLSGPFPSNLGAPGLEMLLMFSNGIVGHLPESICHSQKLIVLDLANNLLVGELPSCSRMESLRYLLLSNNSFSGPFPPFVQSCKNLGFLDLAWNNLSGTLPTWIGNLVQLQFVRLSYNMFSGKIPVIITKLKFLHHLNLAGNNISGSIPLGMSNLTAMTRMAVRIGSFPYQAYANAAGEGGNSLSVVTKGQELKYGVGILDMIPSSLSKITYLSFLNLSENNLTGRIPPGSQLDTLYQEHPSIYDGNSGLCGPPLQKNCSRNGTSTQDGQNRTGHGFEPMSFRFGLVLGLIMGLWLALFTLLLMKAWRIAYFRLFDKLYDQIYVFAVVKWKRLARAGTTD